MALEKEIKLLIKMKQGFPIKNLPAPLGTKFSQYGGYGQVEPGHKKGWGKDWRPEVMLPQPEKAQAQIPDALFRQGLQQPQCSELK